MKIVPFEELSDADLIVDAIYESKGSDASADPISKIFPVGNLSGFRDSGKGQFKNLVCLCTSGENKDWPDYLDNNTGKFIYYGDNKTPGKELHKKRGNQILKNVFEHLHSNENKRRLIPPFFVFKKYPTLNGSRSQQFKGLAVPGYSSTTSVDDLVALWKTSDGERFQNYKATFTIIDVAKINRAWIQDLKKGEKFTKNAPKEWLNWVDNGNYVPLTSQQTISYRTEKEQTVISQNEKELLNEFFKHFDSDDKETKKRNVYIFENCASKIYQMSDDRVVIDEVTRGVVDGGKDAVGRYRLGIDDEPVYVEFSLEAKCYNPSKTTVGVKETSRLISRLRHRQFGVMVTTSTIAKQAYQEVREDNHPVIFICGKDIIRILINNGISTSEELKKFLNNFPVK